MTFQGAVIKEQGVEFALVIVQPHVTSNPTTAAQTIANFEARVFPGLPVVLMSQDAWGTPTYYGRRDIAQFMSSVPLHAVPWSEYTLS